MNIIVRLLSVNILAGFRKRNTSIFDPSSQVTGFFRNIFVDGKSTTILLNFNINKSFRRTAHSTASDLCQTYGQTRPVTKSIMLINLFALMQ